MNEKFHYKLWVYSIGSSVGALKNAYHPDDYALALARYQIYRKNPKVRVVQMTLVLYHDNGNTETVLIRRQERK